MSVRVVPMSSPFFPYPTVSSFFEDQGDFEENVEDAPGMYDDDTWERIAAEDGQENGLDDPEPCCYNSSRNFGTGEHEYGCPNY